MSGRDLARPESSARCLSADGTLKDQALSPASIMKGYTWPCLVWGAMRCLNGETPAALGRATQGGTQTEFFGGLSTSLWGLCDCAGMGFTKLTLVDLCSL